MQDDPPKVVFVKHWNNTNVLWLLLSRIEDCRTSLDARCWKWTKKLIKKPQSSGLMILYLWMVWIALTQMFESVKALMIIKNPVKIKRIVKRRKVNFLSRTGQCLKMIWKLKLMGGNVLQRGGKSELEAFIDEWRGRKGGIGGSDLRKISPSFFRTKWKIVLDVSSQWFALTNWTTCYLVVRPTLA